MPASPSSYPRHKAAARQRRRNRLRCAVSPFLGMPPHRASNRIGTSRDVAVSPGAHPGNVGNQAHQPGGEPEMAKANQSPRPVRSPARGQATPLVRATLRLGIAACDALAVSGGVAERAALARLLGALDVSLASAVTAGTDASGCRARYRELLVQTPRFRRAFGIDDSL